MDQNFWITLCFVSQVEYQNMNRNLIALSKGTHKGRYREWTLLVHSKKTLT